MVYLSNTERQLVAKYRLAEKPTWYDASSSQDVIISDDFESFLILTPQEARSSVVSWLRDSRQLAAGRQDRDALLGEMLDVQLGDAQNQIDEVDKSLANYDKMRDRYFQNIIPEGSESPGHQLANKQSRFSDVVEVGSCLADLNRQVDEFLVARDRAKHLHVMTSVQKVRKNASAVTKQDQLQISSWATPYSAYTNGKT